MGGVAAAISPASFRFSAACNASSRNRFATLYSELGSQVVLQQIQLTMWVFSELRICGLHSERSINMASWAALVLLAEGASRDPAAPFVGGVVFELGSIGQLRCKTRATSKGPS